MKFVITTCGKNWTAITKNKVILHNKPRKINRIEEEIIRTDDVDFEYYLKLREHERNNNNE